MKPTSYVYAALMLSLITGPIWADEVQVEDLGPAPASTSIASPAPTAPVTGSSADDRNEITWQKLQTLQDQVRLLRGQLEDQQHLIDELRQQVKSQYLNTDQRLSAIDARLAQLNPTANTAATPAGEVSTESGADLEHGSNAPATPAGSDIDAEKKAYLAAWGVSRQQGPDQAIPRMLAFIQQYPQSVFLPHADYWLGVFYMKAQQPDLGKAAHYFQGVLKQFPQHSKASAALYQLAIIHEQHGEIDAARVDMQRLLKNYAQSPEAALATSWLKKHETPTRKKKHAQASTHAAEQDALRPVAQALDHIGEYAP